MFRPLPVVVLLQLLLLLLHVVVALVEMPKLLLLLFLFHLFVFYLEEVRVTFVFHVLPVAPQPLLRLFLSVVVDVVVFMCLHVLVDVGEALKLLLRLVLLFV